MAPTPQQVTRLDAHRYGEGELGPTASPHAAGPLAVVHLWLLLVILGSVGVLLLSIPQPVFASALAAVDPVLAGWLAS